MTSQHRRREFAVQGEPDQVRVGVALQDGGAKSLAVVRALRGGAGGDLAAAERLAEVLRRAGHGCAGA